MAEALSQGQIDALLASMSGGSKATDTIEESGSTAAYPKYDFYSPKKFTKDKLNIIKNVYEAYSRILTTRLNSLFRVSSEITILDVQEERYYEFHNAIFDNDAVLTIEPKFKDKFDMTPIVMHTTKPMILSMLDRMLGGMGEEYTDVGYSYEYTDMELQLYKNVSKHFIEIMKDSWSNHLEIDFGLLGIDTTSGVLQQVSVDEIVVIIVIEIKLDNIIGKTSVCIPASLLTKIFSIIERQRKVLSIKVANEQDEEPKQIFDTIKKSDLDIVAKVGKGTVLLRDIYNLKPGDIINLNVPKHEDVDIYIEDTPWFKGKLGIQKKNVAVKISSGIKIT